MAAAIDIGSNSIKMTIGRANGKGGIEQLDWASEVVRLGHGLDRTGLLDKERIEVAIETLKRFAGPGAGPRRHAYRGRRDRGHAGRGKRRQRSRPGEESDRHRRSRHRRASRSRLTFRGLTADADLSGSVWSPIWRREYGTHRRRREG